MKLKNGSEEYDVLVKTVMFIINELLKDGKAIPLYELVMLARDSKHELWGQTGEGLKKLSLIEETTSGYSIHSSIKNIILSSAVGDGLEMEFQDPRE